MSDENGEAPLPRARRSTLDLFNDEMAVLDRPLENDVEYSDEKPPVKRRRLGAIAGAALVLGAAGLLLWSRASGVAAVTPPLVIGAAAPVVAPVVVPVVVPAEAAPPAPAPTPSAPEPVAMADVAHDEGPPVEMPRASSRATWNKVGRAPHHEARKHHHARRH